MSESADQLTAVERVRRADARFCARLISRIESGDTTVNSVVGDLYRVGGKTPVVGFTGPPGSGKSTLVDQFIVRCRAQHERVAVLAIDPSSPFSGGAILGDRVRMSRHNIDSGVFIRSMSARGRLGGLAAAVGDTLVVLDAMGFDSILIETVGVGQNEIDIMRHAHTIVILQTPAGGDSVQAVKAGLLEIGDVFVVNKAEIPGADRIVAGLRDAVEFRIDPHDGERWHPPILKTQASGAIGVDEVVDAVKGHWRHLQSKPREMKLRLRSHGKVRLLDLLAEGLRNRYSEQSGHQDRLEKVLDEVVARRCDPHSAALQLLEAIR